jgi:hypothetical protein
MNFKIFQKILIVGMICLTGCSDFFDTTPTDRITDKLAWENAENVQMYMNTFYAYIDRYGIFSEPSQFNGNFTEGLTETLKYGSYLPGSREGDANNYVFTPERITPEGSLLCVWKNTYERIRRVNDFLAGLEKYSKLNATQNAQYEAQARFFRAFLYFQLAKRHDGVILYKNMDLQRDIDRSTAAETWNLIEEDLDFAASLLPKKAPSVGRLTKGAAFAFKSRAMLYAKRWEEAKAAADSVFAQEIYELTLNYADAYKGSNSESILQYGYLVTGPNHTFDRYYATYGEVASQGGSGVPTQEMVEAYEVKTGQAAINWSAWHTAAGTTTPPPYQNLEARFHATVIYPGATWQGKTMENSVNGTNGQYMDYREDTNARGRTVTGYYLKKFRDETNTNLSTYNSTHAWVELRLAEVYLNRAEANFRLNNAMAALEDVNAVRKRAEVNLPELTGLTGDNLFNAIRQERKIELAYEGHLYWDMRRWELAHVEYNNYRVHGLKVTKEADVNHYQYVDCDLQDRRFIQKTYVLPIPEEEIANNMLIQQYEQWR